MPMLISYSYHHGEDKVFETESETVLIGRRQQGIVVDLDLAPDMMVSSPHAKIWREDDEYWIEDLDSAWGTRVNGEEIGGSGRRRLRSAEQIGIGDWHLAVQIPEEYTDPYASHPSRAAGPLETITQTFDASAAVFTGDESSIAGAESLALFYDLPLRLGQETKMSSLLHTIAERAGAAVPGAFRSAVLIRNRKTHRLALKAHYPSEKPVVSLTMAEHAIEKRVAFIWPPAGHSSVATSVEQNEELPGAPDHPAGSSIYAPLLWRDEALGVVYVDHGGSRAPFQTEELRLLQALAHHAAMAIANLQTHEDWKHQNEVQHNFLKLVSPQIAERLKQQHRRIHLGGEFCHATILLSDIRGFTNLSAHMSPHEVTEMLDDYFGRLVPIVFKYHGTVDKFVGDAILAVFGSPESDEQQHLHAVRAAVAMQNAMREVNAQRAAQHKRTSELGIGVHCGEVVHGLIGTTKRMEFTVIGDAVNRASRYCDGAHAGEVLISPEVYQRVSKLVEAEETSIATKHEGDLPAFRIIHVRGVKDNSKKLEAEN